MTKCWCSRARICINSRCSATTYFSSIPITVNQVQRLSTRVAETAPYFFPARMYSSVITPFRRGTFQKGFQRLKREEEDRNISLFHNLASPLRRGEGLGSAFPLATMTTSPLPPPTHTHSHTHKPKCSSLIQTKLKKVMMRTLFNQANSLFTNFNNFIMTISMKESAHCRQDSELSGCHLSANNFLAAVTPTHRVQLFGKDRFKEEPSLREVTLVIVGF